MNLLQTLTRSAWPPSGGVLDALSGLFNGTNGSFGLNQTLGGKVENIDSGFASLVNRAYAADPIVFACMMARSNLFVQANFTWRQVRNGKPGDLFGTPALSLLEHPWANATTGDLLAYMINHADIAGNAFVVRTVGSDGNPMLKPLRPDWVTMVLGSKKDATVQAGDLEAEFLGIIYTPGGMGMGRPSISLDRSEICHFAPIKDPLASYRGMSWLTPVIREVMGDQAATEHKLQFFQGGATVNLALRVAEPDLEKFRKIVAMFREQHEGSVNAYKTLFLQPGIDPVPIGANLQQVEFKATQGAGETRIAAAARVPAVIAGISEGLQGSALNEGNYASAMRQFAELTMHGLWQNVCGSLETIVPPPARAELWFDTSDIPALKVDRQEAAQIQQTNAITAETYIRSGFTAESIIKAIVAEDMTLLQHTGLFSVQLQAPGGKGLPEGEAPGEVPVSGGDAAPGKPVDAAPGATVPTPPAKPVPPTNGKTPVPAK